MEKGFECYCCGNKNDLDLHHITYARIFKEEFDDVVPVCRRCHDKIHRLHKKHQNETIFFITEQVKYKKPIKKEKVVLTKEQLKLLRKIKRERKQRRKIIRETRNKNNVHPTTHTKT